MKRDTLAILLGTVVLGGTTVSVLADLRDNPYQSIVSRNAFALKPPPPPAPPPDPNQQPPSAVEVFLTGISTLGGTKKVLLQVVDKAKKPDFLPPLVEGDAQDRIEVVSIDPEQGAVVIKIDGVEKQLTFDKNAPKPSASPAPAMPGAPIPTPPPIPNPALASAASANPAPSRSGVVVGGATSYAPTAAPLANTSSADMSTARPLRTDAGASSVLIGGPSGSSSASGSTSASTTPAATPAMSAEQAIAAINRQKQMRQELEAAGVPRSMLGPPLPPTPGFNDTRSPISFPTARPVLPNSPAR